MDGIDMDSDPTAVAMDRMSAAGTRLGDDWGASRDRIDLLGGQLGQGELGAAFMDGYHQPAAETMTAVDLHCGRPGRLAATGHQGVHGYRSSDQDGADGVNAVAS